MSEEEQTQQEAMDQDMVDQLSRLLGSIGQTILTNEHIISFKVIVLLLNHLNTKKKYQKCSQTYFSVFKSKYFVPLYLYFS